MSRSRTCLGGSLGEGHRFKRARAGGNVFATARKLLILSLTVAAPALAAMFAPATANAAIQTAKDGNLRAFSGGVSVLDGTLQSSSRSYGGDRRTFAANYLGGTGSNGYARGSFKVHWTPGETVVYSAAFFLPATFHSATSGQQPSFHSADSGQQWLIRWDTFPGSGGRILQGGVVVDYGSDSASLVSATASGSTSSQRVIAGPFNLPKGRWFKLQVRQLLGSGSSAYSNVYVNGKLVSSSHAPTFSGKQVTHIRFGIVQLSGGAQQGQASLNFDQATASVYGTYVNPFSGDYYVTGRTDMGVDLCLTTGEPIRAVGDGVVVGISPDWFEGQPYIWYRLLDGPYAGRYVYVAEEITRLAHVGQRLSAGEPVAYFKSSGTCIETGWGAADGETLAQATTGYWEGERTPAGVSFARFLISLHVHGPYELTSDTTLRPAHATRYNTGRKPAPDAPS